MSFYFPLEKNESICKFLFPVRVPKKATLISENLELRLPLNYRRKHYSQYYV